jgi:putative transposase
VLKICDVPRSTYYWRLRHPERKTSNGGGRPIPGYSRDKDGRMVPDARIKTCIRQLVQGPHHASGYRKLKELLRQKYRLVINKKKVYRLCKELGILLPQRERKHPVPRKIARNRVVTGPNQLWQMDIKYGYVAGLDRHFYMASIIDVFDRRIVGYHVDKVCHTQQVVQAVRKALLKRDVHGQSRPLVIRTDNGTQFKSKAFYEFCQQMNLEHERIPNKQPDKNAYIEAFHSILERECLRWHSFETFEQAFKEVDRFIRFYNTERLHGSLEDFPPTEYLELVKAGVIPPQRIAA